MREERQREDLQAQCLEGLPTRATRGQLVCDWSALLDGVPGDDMVPEICDPRSWIDLALVQCGGLERPDALVVNCHGR